MMRQKSSANINVCIKLRDNHAIKTIKSSSTLNQSQNSSVQLVIMLSKTLPVALLAGAASAACPLSISIADTDAHTVSVAVTNTGSEAVQIFKGNTVFSAHATKDLLVADAGK